MATAIDLAQNDFNILRRWCCLSKLTRARSVWFGLFARFALPLFLFLLLLLPLLANFPARNRQTVNR